MDKRLLPSERAVSREETKAALDKAAMAERDKLKDALRAIGNTPDGLIVLQWLYAECGANQAILGAVNGQIDEKATLYQAMRLNVWIKVRKLLSFNILKEIEFDASQI